MSNETQIADAFWQSSSEALFTQKTVAAVLGLTEAWCERMRWCGGGPVFVKLGRSVRYRKSDLVAWINNREMTSTSPTTPRAAELARGRAVHQGG